MKYGINLVTAIGDSAVSVYSLNFKQVNITNKIAYNYNVTTTEDPTLFVLGNNVSRILKLCLGFNKGRQYLKDSK